MGVHLGFPIMSSLPRRVVRVASRPAISRSAASSAVVAGEFRVVDLSDLSLIVGSGVSMIARVKGSPGQKT